VTFIFAIRVLSKCTRNKISPLQVLGSGKCINFASKVPFAPFLPNEAATNRAQNASDLTAFFTAPNQSKAAFIAADQLGWLYGSKCSTPFAICCIL